MKTYSVTYNTTVSYEAVIQAKSEKEARQKVVEVIGQPLKIEWVREITHAE